MVHEVMKNDNGTKGKVMMRSASLRDGKNRAKYLIETLLPKEAGRYDRSSSHMKSINEIPSTN